MTEPGAALITVVTAIQDEHRPPRIELVIDEFREIAGGVELATKFAQVLAFGLSDETDGERGDSRIGHLQAWFEEITNIPDKFSSDREAANFADRLIERFRYVGLPNIMGVPDAEIRVLGAQYQNPLDAALQISAPPLTNQIMSIMLDGPPEGGFSSEQFAQRVTALALALAAAIPTATPVHAKIIADLVKAALLVAEKALKNPKRKWDLKGIAGVLGPLTKLLQTFS